MRARAQAGTRAAWIVTCVAVALWGVRWVWGPELPPGVDATGHLTRLEVGLDLLSNGRIDGWFDRAMLGYQIHLLYGPGFALVVGIVRILSLGTVSIPGAYELVGVAAYVALPFAAYSLARGFGLPVGASRAAGLLSLAVSSGRGGGLEGAFDLGLMPNHVAAPLVLVAWGLMLRDDDHQRPVLLGLVVSAVLITHPQSFVLFCLFAPLVLLAGWACGTVDRGRWRPITVAALVAAGSSAWWWLPAVAHRGLRGVLTSWDIPGFVDHLQLIWDGERGWIGWSAVLVSAAWVAGLVYGALQRDRSWLALAALPIAALALLHVLDSTFADRYPDVIFLPNRGLMWAAHLAAPIAGLVLARMFGRFESAAWGLAAVVTAVSIGTLVPPDGTFDRPVDGMRAAADTLAEVVDDGERFAYVESDVDQIGVPAPGRWLGWTSGRINLGPFGAEFAPGVGLTLLVFEPPDATSVDEWIDRVRPLAVTHLVAGDPETATVLAAARDLRQVATHDPVTIWEIGGPRSVEVVEHEPEHQVLDIVVNRPEPFELPVGFHPGWTASTEEGPVVLGRSADGLLTVALPAGPHRIELDWAMPPEHAIGWAITLGALTAFLGTRLLLHRRRGRLPA